MRLQSEAVKPERGRGKAEASAVVVCVMDCGPPYLEHEPFLTSFLSLKNPQTSLLWWLLGEDVSGLLPV